MNDHPDRSILTSSEGEFRPVRCWILSDAVPVLSREPAAVPYRLCCWNLDDLDVRGVAEDRPDIYQIRSLCIRTSSSPRIGRYAVSSPEITMTNYDVLREFGSGITQGELDQAVERSAGAIESMREEGHVISYLGSEVYTDESGAITATMCRYDAESEADVREQSERAELPVSGVFLRGSPVDAAAPRAGVVPKSA